MNTVELLQRIDADRAFLAELGRKRIACFTNAGPARSERQMEQVISRKWPILKDGQFNRTHQTLSSSNASSVSSARRTSCAISVSLAPGRRQVTYPAHRLISPAKLESKMHSEEDASCTRYNTPAHLGMEWTFGRPTFE